MILNDLDYLQRAVDISRYALGDGGNTPFGALVVEGRIVGGIA